MEEFGLQLGANGFTLHEGPVLSKSVLRFRSFVCEPMQYGRLLLAGDAAHTVPPTGAKGLNLALADVKVLAEALASATKSRSETALAGFSERALDRVWKAQVFSYWMTSMLHLSSDPFPFDLQRQRAEISAVIDSRGLSTFLGECYTGWPQSDRG